MAWSDAARAAAAEARRKKGTQRVKVGSRLSVSRKEYADQLRAERRSMTSRRSGNAKAFNKSVRSSAKRSLRAWRSPPRDWGTLPGGQVGFGSRGRG